MWIWQTIAERINTCPHKILDFASEFCFVWMVRERLKQADQDNDIGYLLAILLRFLQVCWKCSIGCAERVQFCHQCVQLVLAQTVLWFCVFRCFRFWLILTVYQCCYQKNKCKKFQNWTIHFRTKQQRIRKELWTSDELDAAKWRPSWTLDPTIQTSFPIPRVHSKGYFFTSFSIIHIEFTWNTDVLSIIWRLRYAKHHSISINHKVVTL